MEVSVHIGGIRNLGCTQRIIRPNAIAWNIGLPVIELLVNLSVLW